MFRLFRKRSATVPPRINTASGQSTGARRPILEHLADYIDTQLEAGYPCHKLIHEIREQMYESYTAAMSGRAPKDYLYHPELRAADTEAINNWMAVSNMLTRYETEMSNRCLRGRELERLGRIEEAIELYQANVHDMHGGSMSYDRLRIIYTRQKEYRKAAEACAYYLALPWPREDAKEPFRHHMNKLVKKAQSQLPAPLTPSMSEQSSRRRSGDEGSDQNTYDLH